MFDRYVSLGNNCEVAFQMRRVLGRDESGFFSWNVTPLKSLVSLLESDFSGILEVGNLKNEPEKGLLFDASHGFHVHSSFKTGTIQDEDDFGQQLDALRAKFGHFTAKFREGCATDQRTAYFFKTEDKGSLTTQVEQVDRLLRRMHRGAGFRLVVARPRSHKDDEVDSDTVAFRYLARVAPWADATDGHVRSWDAIFKEFPIAGGLRLAGF